MSKKKKKKEEATQEDIHVVSEAERMYYEELHQSLEAVSDQINEDIKKKIEFEGNHAKLYCEKSFSFQIPDPESLKKNTRPKERWVKVAYSINDWLCDKKAVEGEFEVVSDLVAGQLKKDVGKIMKKVSEAMENASS